MVIVREPGTPSSVATAEVTYPVRGASLHEPSRVRVWNRYKPGGRIVCAGKPSTFGTGPAAAGLAGAGGVAGVLVPAAAGLRAPGLPCACTRTPSLPASPAISKHASSCAAQAPRGGASFNL